MAEDADSTFTLRIVFSGLCLFVEDHHREDGRALVHVLLPHTGGHDSHDHDHVEAHEACLIYDGRYEGKNERQKLSLDGRTVELRLPESMPTGDARMGDTSRIVNLTTSLGEQVPRSLLGEVDAPVLARITLESGQTGDRATGATWRFGAVRQPMTTWVEWVMQGRSAHEVGLVIRNRSEDVRWLTPQDGSIRLFVYHTLPDQIPAENQDLWPIVERHASRDPAHHFRAYYHLVTGHRSEPIPKHHEPFQTVRPTETLGTDYSCMVAMAEAVPQSAAGAASAP